MLPNRPKLEAIHEDVLRALRGEWNWQMFANEPDVRVENGRLELGGHWIFYATNHFAAVERGDEYEPQDIRQACLELEFLGLIACRQEAGTWVLTDRGERWLQERDRELAIVTEQCDGTGEAEAGGDKE